MSKPFWQTKTLAEMTPDEWESLCDGCGLCCLQKLEDEDEGGIYYTRIACRQLDLKTCRCKDYSNRLLEVPECLQLTVDQAVEFRWLPKTCAYRLLSEGKPLRRWHHLVSGDRHAVHRAGISQMGRMLCETQVPDEDWEDHIIAKAG